MKLIVLAAGKGKRFMPLSNTMPKGMITVLGEPLLKHVVKPYLKYVSDIIFVINEPLGLQIKDYFKENYRGHNIFYRTQYLQKGTMDAIMVCKDLITDGELFCVCNGDDLVKESDVGASIQQKAAGLGISKKIMPKNYLGIRINNGYIEGFQRHGTNEDFIEDIFYNGFSILDNKIFQFEPVSTRDGEWGLPQTLFARLGTYPLKAFEFESWETVNGPGDIPATEKFLKSL